MDHFPSLRQAQVELVEVDVREDVVPLDRLVLAVEAVVDVEV